MTIAPLIRGLFLNVVKRPVLVERTAASATVHLCPTGTTDEEIARSLRDQLGEVTLPCVVSAGEETFHVREIEVSSPRAVAGRIALVTGGAQGFGAELVRGLAAEGCYVYIADLNIEGAAELASELGECAHPIRVDVSDPDSVAAMFDEVAATTGGLDLVISCAGVVRAGAVLDQPLRDFEFVTKVNYTAFFVVTQAAARLLRRQWLTAPRWWTDIIEINSKSGLVGSNRNGAYAGSKFGGIGLVQSFALELVDYAIKVNAICPGNFFDGPLWSDPDRGLFVQYLKSGKVPGATTVSDVKAFYEAKVPMARGAHGVDVLRAIFYLVEQVYETGQALPVTGGQVMMN